MQKANKEMNSKNIAVGIGVGTLVSLITSLLLAALVTTLIARENVTENKMDIFSLVIQCIAALIGAIFAYRMVRTKCMFVTGITSLAYLLLLCMISIVFYNGVASSAWGSVLAVGLGFLAACTVCISNGGKRRKRKRASR